MAAINKPNPAYVVKPGMTQAFIEALIAQKHSVDYWDECRSSRKEISKENMDKLMKICNED